MPGAVAAEALLPSTALLFAHNALLKKKEPQQTVLKAIGPIA